MSASPSPLTRGLLAALMLTFPTVYVWKVATAERVPAPLPEPPSAVDAVFLTVGEWPDPQFLPESPAFARLASRSASPGPIYAGSDRPAASAVTLWTGRAVPNHGVTDAERSLPSGAWTLARAARDSGARTAAFLQAPMITRQGISGFDQVVEGPELSPERLATLAVGFLEAERDERAVVWVHLDRPGPAGAFVEQVLAAIQTSRQASGDDVDTLTVFTALSGPDDGWMEAGAKVPLYIQLPTSMEARARGEGQASHVQLTALLRALLRLTGPNAAFDEAPVQARAEGFWNAVRGGGVYEPVWVQGTFGLVFRREGLRVAVAPGASETQADYDLRLLPGPRATGERAPAVAREHAELAVQTFLDARAEVLRSAQPSLPAPGAGQ